MVQHSCNTMTDSEKIIRTGQAWRTLNAVVLVSFSIAMLEKRIWSRADWIYANRIDEFKAMKKPLVLCCLSGGRSGQAVEFLAANGVEDIYNGGGWNMVAMRKG